MGQASSSSSAASAINDSGGDFAVGGKPNVLGYVVAALVVVLVVFAWLNKKL